MVGDKRWHNLPVLAATGTIFLSCVIIAGISAVALKNTILSQYLHDSNVWPGFISAILLGFAGVSVIHTIIDLSVFLCSALKPVYVVSMSSIMMIFWLGLVGVQAAQQASGALWKDCYADSGVTCYEPVYYVSGKERAQLGLSVIIWLAYVIAIALSAIAHRRFKKKTTEEKKRILHAAGILAKGKAVDGTVALP